MHGAGAAALAIAPETAPQIGLALATNHAVIAAAGMFPRSRWLGPNMSRLPPEVSPGILALTFDDGPDPEGTPAVLDLLERRGHRATFFCIGRRALQHRALVASIRSRGHGVENHSYTHPNTFSFHGPGGLHREIHRGQQALERACGERPRFFRAPVGIQNPFLAAAVADEALMLVSWTRRGFDTVSKDARRVAGRLIGPGLAGGDILLLHDRMPVTIDALTIVLDEMEARGLRSEALHLAVAGETRLDDTPVTASD